jgi:DNA polymerase III delta prime subunit
MKNSEELHAKIHKELQENIKNIADVLYAFAKVMEYAKFSCDSLNEQVQVENHLKKIKSNCRKIQKQYVKE